MLVSDNELESSIHIDFVPMADVLFNLLIFFLLATTIAQAEREINVALPTANAAAPISAVMREIIITVDQEGRAHVGGMPIEHEALRRQIEQAVKDNPEQKVSIRGDKRTAYANVMRVLDICKASGLQEPYLDAVLEE